MISFKKKNPEIPLNNVTSKVITSIHMVIVKACRHDILLQKTLTHVMGAYHILPKYMSLSP